MNYQTIIQQLRKENTLLNQEFIKDSKKTVAQYLKEATGDATCEGFFRFQLGE